MKKILLTPASRNSAIRIPLVLGVACALTFLHLNASALEISPGTDNYVVLAGSTITTGDLGLISDNMVIGDPIAHGLYKVDDAPPLLVENDLIPAASFSTTASLHHRHPEGPGSSVPDTGSTLLLLAFALAIIFASKGPFTVFPGKADLIRS